MIRHESNEIFSSPGDDQINLLLQLQHLPDRLPLRMRKDLDGPLWESHLGEDLPKNLSNGLIRMKGFRASPQDDTVARFETEACGIGSHIGPRLINDSNDPNG